MSWRIFEPWAALSHRILIAKADSRSARELSVQRDVSSAEGGA
jgi:hypothetical protein